jgi:hypothetical protein
MAAMAPDDDGRDVSLRYLYRDGSVQAVLPMRTVADDGETFVGYTPAGTEIMYWALEDGTDPRTVPLAERFGRPLTTAPRVWEGNGVLRVIPRGENFQVVHFWDEHGIVDRLEGWPAAVGDWSGYVPPASWRALPLPARWDDAPRGTRPDTRDPAAQPSA